MALVCMLSAALILELGVLQQTLLRARADPYLCIMLLAKATLAYLVEERLLRSQTASQVARHQPQRSVAGKQGDCLAQTMYKRSCQGSGTAW